MLWNPALAKLLLCLVLLGSFPGVSAQTVQGAGHAQARDFSTPGALAVKAAAPAPSLQGSIPYLGFNASPQLSDPLKADASVGVDIRTSSSQATYYNFSDYPHSLSYQPYVSVGTGRLFSLRMSSGPAALSVGVMNGTANIVAAQDGVTLLSTTVVGVLSYYESLSFGGSDSYRYVDFNSVPSNLTIDVTPVSGIPVVAYNVYNDSICSYTASLIMYPPQFGMPFSPLATDALENTGMSFLLVAPKFDQPTPIAILISEGYTDPVTGEGWYAQVGCDSWGGNNNVSQAIYETFSDTYGSPFANSNYRLIPGDTYNFTMAVVSGTTWEFTVNGTAISQEGAGNGFWSTTATANGGENFGFEGLPDSGGNINVTNLIDVPVAMSLRVDGKWIKAPELMIGSIGENWWNGQGGLSPGIDVWGVEGNLENSSIPVGALEISDSLSRVFAVPGSPGPSYAPAVSIEPMYGNFSYPQVSSGSGLVNVTKVSSTVLQISPLNGTAYVSVVSYRPGDNYIASITNVIIKSEEQIAVPPGTSVAVVYAASGRLNIAPQASYAKTTSEVVQIAPVATTTSVTCQPASVPVGSPIRCTAVVEGGNSPGGTVNFASTSSTGTFIPSNGQCTLSARLCSVTYSDPVAGTPKIMATYGGNSGNAGSSGAFSPSITSLSATSSTTMSSTSSTTTSTSPSSVPSGIVAYVPITITNSQSSPTPAPFQQIIQVDSATYSTYEASNLQNVEFFSSNWTIIPSWLESGNSNTATNTIYWLSVASGIPASSSINVYMGFASPATNLLNNLTTGESPQLSPSYGQYDNGKIVFQFYDNFNGSSIDTSIWTVESGMSYTVDNGFSSNGGTRGHFIYSATEFSPGSILDFNGTLDLSNVSSYASVGIMDPNSSSYSIFQQPAPGEIYGITDNQYANGGSEIWTGSYGFVPLSGIFSIYLVNETSTIFQLDYGNSHALTANSALIYPSPITLMYAGGVFSGSFAYDWIRVRALPPNGSMPGVAFGPVVSTTTSSTTSSKTSTSAISSTTSITTTITTSRQTSNSATTSATSSSSTSSIAASVSTSPTTVTGTTSQSSTTTQTSVTTASGVSQDLTLYLVAAGVVVVVAGLVGFGLGRRKKSV